MRICVPITAITTSAAFEDINKAQHQGADLLELRLDYLQDLSSDNLATLIRACTIPVIVTARSREEGGNGEGDYTPYFEQAINLGVAFVDLEFINLPKFNLKNSQAIYSYHNFKQTPSLDELKSIYDSMIKAGADIAKIACFAHSEEDNNTIYKLIKSAPRDQIIALAMGAIGRETRIKGPELGSYLTFASLTPDKSSAPGQITISELRKPHIAIVGGRGVGKSRAALELSKAIHRPLYSMDQLITQKYGKDIGQLVKEKGWGYFREIEYQILNEICHSAAGIIDCGGGVICEQDSENRQSFSNRKAELLKKNCTVIWLAAKPETQASRIKNDHQRPSLTGTSSVEELKDVMELRNPWYQQVADHKLTTDDSQPLEVSEHIIELMFLNT